MNAGVCTSEFATVAFIHVPGMSMTASMDVKLADAEVGKKINSSNDPWSSVGLIPWLSAPSAHRQLPSPKKYHGSRAGSRQVARDPAAGAGACPDKSGSSGCPRLG